MKKKNYKCCGKKYKNIDITKFNEKCLSCKKGAANNKYIVCCHVGYLGRKNDKKAKILKQNTAYYENHMNYIITCKKCFEEIESYWKGMWADYYSMIMR